MDLTVQPAMSASAHGIKPQGLLAVKSTYRPMAELQHSVPYRNRIDHRGLCQRRAGRNARFDDPQSKRVESTMEQQGRTPQVMC